MKISEIKIPVWVDVLFILLCWTGLYFGWQSEPLYRKLVGLSVVVSLTLEAIVKIGLTAKRDHTLVMLPINVTAVVSLLLSWDSATLFWKVFTLFYCVPSIDLGIDRLFTEKLKKDRKSTVGGFVMILTYLFLVGIVIDRALHHDYLMALLVALALLSFFGLLAWKWPRNNQTVAESER